MGLQADRWKESRVCGWEKGNWATGELRGKHKKDWGVTTRAVRESAGGASVSEGASACVICAENVAGMSSGAEDHSLDLGLGRTWDSRE
mmetsp:Transcript_59780/g.144026  ORF Transcript_59780/g.144026 Transcript_59780/m.144026 type:complete len:89 (+) Transcript_59780:422-688(+)